MTDRQRDEAHRSSPVGELWQSVILIALTVSTLAAPVGLAMAAVRLFAR
ncbi:MAG TPA: hypothetical protein VJ922_03450 [Actinomycetota bacterium]|nr:hypothetical protein [Actinomycetota bacterium]